MKTFLGTDITAESRIYDREELPFDNVAVPLDGYPTTGFGLRPFMLGFRHFGTYFLAFAYLGFVCPLDFRGCLIFPNYFF